MKVSVYFSPNVVTINKIITLGDHKIEDRKIPRPIGTERNWKNSQGHNATYGVGPSGDMDPANWLVEPKINWPGARNINPVFAGNPTPYRIPLPEELPQLIDSPYQVLI